MFDRIDKDNDGCISKDEARKVYSDNMVDKLFKVYDTDQSGALEKGEVADVFNLKCDFGKRGVEKESSSLNSSKLQSLLNHTSTEGDHESDDHAPKGGNPKVLMLNVHVNHHM